MAKRKRARRTNYSNDLTNLAGDVVKLSVGVAVLGVGLSAAARIAQSGSQ